MAAINRIEQILKGDGYAVNLTELTIEGERYPGPLVVSFNEDDKGRELALLIETTPVVEGGDTGIIAFSLVYPLRMESAEVVPEVVRLLFILNRLLPIGQHGFCEQTPAIFFKHNLLVKDPATVEEEVIKDAVGMIGLFTRNHCGLIDQVIDGDLDCDSLLEKLALDGVALPGMFGSALE